MLLKCHRIWQPQTNVSDCCFTCPHVVPESRTIAACVQVMVERLAAVDPVLLSVSETMAPCVQVMVERLAAVEAVLLQPPIVSGRFTSAPFLHLGQPVHPQNSACMSTVAQLMR